MYRICNKSGGCPVLWCSKLQKEIPYSTTEAEYIALSQAVRKVIPFIAFIKEISFIFDIHLPKLEVFCRVFKYNQGCISVTDYQKLS